MGNDDHVLLVTNFEHLSRVGEQIWREAKYVQISCEDILPNSITDSSSVYELMDCSATVFVNEFSNFFSIFCRLAAV
jgi:hypothetical protein